MRIVLAAPFLALVALAASPLLAQKPGADLDPEREHWRGQGISLCVAELNGLDGVTPDDSEAICGCAFDRFLAGRDSETLPPLDASRLRGTIGGPILGCTFEQTPARAGAVSRWMAATPTIVPPPAVAPVALTPIERAEPDKPAATDERSGPGLRAWLDGLSLPRWLSGSGLPSWAWVLLVTFVFLFVRGLLRGGEERDLLGPPPAMRRGGYVGPPPRR